MKRAFALPLGWPVHPLTKQHQLNILQTQKFEKRNGANGHHLLPRSSMIITPWFLNVFEKRNIDMNNVKLTEPLIVLKINRVQ